MLQPRLQGLLDQAYNINRSIKVLMGKDTKGYRNHEILNLKDRAVQVKDRINRFGSRYTLVQVNMLYGEEKKACTLYYVDITPEEAVDYVKWKMTGTIHKISAHNIPVGRPITI